MVVSISADPRTDARLVNITLDGLTPGTKYDLYRLQHRYVGENSSGAPVYQREVPDRRKYWSSVAHRISWTPGSAHLKFRDYGPLLRPFRYFIVPSAAIGPYEYDWKHEPDDYPVSRGVLDNEIVHLNRLLLGVGTAHKGEILIRSTWHLGLWGDACVYDMDEITYRARTNELAVLGREDPVFVSDTRETRRGRLTLVTEQLHQYNTLRKIIFPANGRIRPIGLHSGSDSTMLLDDMIVLPLDVSVEQATQSNPDMRFIHIDWVEVDGSEPRAKVLADNDVWTIEPEAKFTISNAAPLRGEWVTLTDTSTGEFEHWHWTMSRGSNNEIGEFYGPGPHEVRFSGSGEKSVKLRVSGPEGADVKVKTITVGRGHV